MERYKMFVAYPYGSMLTPACIGFTAGEVHRSLDARGIASADCLIRAQLVEVSDDGETASKRIRDAELVAADHQKTMDLCEAECEELRTALAEKEADEAALIESKHRWFDCADRLNHALTCACDAISESRALTPREAKIIKDAVYAYEKIM